MSKVARILVASIFILFISTGILHAQGAGSSEKNSVAVKGGWHFYEKSDFTKFWEISPSDIHSFAAEVSYERELTKFLSLEIPFGYFYSDKIYNYSSIVVLGDTGSIDLKIWNLYLSPSLKVNIPVAKEFKLYLGAGPDLYYTAGIVEGNYQSSTVFGNYKNDGEKFSLGVHGLAGVEYFPASPWGLFLEYKYSYVSVKDFDKVVIDDINSIAGSSLGYNDFNVGGHLVFFGVRYHF
jgi:opacity protein-like surface antigen